MATITEKPPLTQSAPSNHSSASIDVKEKASASRSGSQLEVANINQGVDVVVGLLKGHDQDADLEPEVAGKLRRKLDWHILPLLCTLYTLQFIDKNSLGAVSILGIFEDAHLTRNQFNNLASAFYIGYIVFVWPHSWMMQHFPIGKYIAANIFSWAIFIGLHPVCKNYGGLFALRFLLGASEGCITSGIMTIITMFYTRTEAGERINWTFQCNGVAIVISSLLGFGIAHMNEHVKPARWHWFMIIMAISTALTAVAFWVWFPDNPATARFLSDQEKVDVVNRIRCNQNGIETKVWKRSQFVEALTDPKTWLFFLFASISNLQGGTGTQYAIILKAFGFSTIQASLLNLPSGPVMIFAVTLAAYMLRKFPNARAWIAIFGFLPAIAACIMMLTLKSSNKGGLLAGLYLVVWSGAGFITVLSWVAVTSAGHTKKMTVNAVFLIGYALGQMLSTQFWKAKYAPRYRVPWIIQMMTYVFDIILILIIRVLLNYQNKRRDRIKAETGKVYEEFGYVEVSKEDGTVEKYKVPIAMLDVTDKENEAFRYVL